MAFDERNLEQLSEQLKDFTKGMSDFISRGGFTGGNNNTGTDSSKDASKRQQEKIAVAFDKSTQKIVNSLALLAAQLTKNARSEAQKNRYIDNFNDSIKKVTDSQEKSYNREMKRSTAQERWDERNRQREAKQKQRDAERQRADEEFKKQAEKSYEEFFEGLEKSANKVTSFGKRMANSNGSLSDAVDLTSDAISGTAGAAKSLFAGLSNVSAAIPKYGAILSGIFSGLSGLSDLIGKITPIASAGAKLMVEQFEKGLAAFSKITDVGLVSSFEELRNVSDTMKLTFDDVAAATGKYSADLAAAGGTASKGMKLFADVGKELEDSRLGFRALGLSAAQIAEYQSKYIAQEARFGLVKDRDAKSLAAGTKKYIEQLTLLSALTGESREAMQAKEDSARGETQYAAALELRKGTKEFDELTNFNRLMEATYGSQFAKGVRGNIGGTPMGPEALEANLQTGGEITEILDQVKRGLIDGHKGYEMVLAATKRARGARGDIEFSEIVGDIPGSGYTNMPNIMAAHNKKPITREASAAALAKIKQQEEDAKNGKTYAGAAAQTQEAMYQVSVNMQQLATKQGALTTITEIATKTMEGFNKAIKEASDFFGGESTNSVDGSSPVKVETATKKSEASMKDVQQILKDPKATKEQKTAALNQSWKDMKALQEEVNPSPSTVAKNKKAAEEAKSTGSTSSSTASGPTNRPTSEPTSGSTGSTSSSPTGSLPPGDVTSRLLDYIGKHESMGGNYNILVGGKSEPNLTNMKVSEILEYQSGMRQRGHETTAVGKYQILKGTLEGLINNGHARLDDKFDSATQDKLAIGLLKGRGLDSFLAGKMPKDAFADNLSKEWASLPYHTGQSYYAGVGSNKAGASRESFMATLGARTGGIFKGPSTGYTVELHGDEAVVPMNEGVSKQALNTSVFNQDNSAIDKMVSMFETMQYKYDQMIDLLSRQADNGDKLVQAAY